MKLKKMSITGFKSFADKAVIDFPKGVSAIVGPNGCGKSNIVDALRWAMGEQSVKQLRGKSMEDVIFAGANGKQPLNMAEVTLTLINDNGSAPEELKDFSEIMMTRRLYRSGESAYLINKRPCRLKDIHHLFMGSGMGARSYAVIQQGNIGAITDAGPEERRFYIEEAAGITRFKSRKIEALKKVEATKQNLFRLNDLILEVKRQMEGSKRQAKKAEAYQKIWDRIRFVDIRLAIHQYDGFSKDILETDELLKGLKDKDIALTVSLQKLDAAVETINLQRRQKNQEISDRKSDKFEIQRDIDRTESELSHLREKIERLAFEIGQLQNAGSELQDKNRAIEVDIEREIQVNAVVSESLKQVETALAAVNAESMLTRNRLHEMNRTLNQAKSAYMELVNREIRYKHTYQQVTDNLEKLKRRLKQIAEEEALVGKNVEALAVTEQDAARRLESLNEEQNELEERLRDSKKHLQTAAEALGRQVKAVQAVESDRNRIRSEYKALKTMEDNFEWYRDGVKAVMRSIQNHQLEGIGRDQIVGLTADLLTPEADCATAVEAALGDALQYIVTRDAAVGERIIDYLRRQKAGRCGVIPVAGLTVAGFLPEAVAEIDPLLKHVRVADGYEAIGALLLGRIALISERSQAETVFRRSPDFDAAVTPDGDVITRQGVMNGGSRETLSGILAKKQQLSELRSESARLDQTLETAQCEQDRLETEIRNLETELKHLVEEKEEVAQDALNAEKTHFKAAEDVKAAQRRLEAIHQEQEELMAEESGIDQEMARYKAAWEQIRQEVVAAEAATAKVTAEIQAVTADMERYNARIMELKIEMTALSGKLDNNRQTLTRLKDYQQDSVKRAERLALDIRAKDEKRTGSKQVVAETEKRLATLYDDLKQLEKVLESSESAYQAIEEKLKQSDASMAGIRVEKEEMLKKIRIMELDQSQRKIKRDNIAARLEERYHAPLNRFRQELLQQHLQTGVLPPDEAAGMEQELVDLKERLAKIGDVNLGAIKEFQEQETRFNFLNTQREDLEKALDDLHKVIQKINRITQERFMETFNQVNAQLAEVFPRLFDGGTANLVLTEPNRPLETGVEFMVHPPGKKLTRLSLLSGGEKALSAIAFIFSIFLIKPASFCIMDEIDAPLDEANVLRFNQLLKIIGEKSQIIMITHKKKSMEFADILFGVTMEKKGVSKIVSVNLE